MIKVKKDDWPAWEPKENCALCRAPTNYWHEPSDVACCTTCALTHKPSDLPTKAEWCAKENALNPQPRSYACR